MLLTEPLEKAHASENENEVLSVSMLPKTSLLRSFREIWVISERTFCIFNGNEYLLERIPVWIAHA